MNCTPIFPTPPTAAAWRRRCIKSAPNSAAKYPLGIGGESVSTGDKLTSLNPSNTKEVVGVHHKATRELAKRAVEEAYAYFPEWSRTPATERIRMLLDVAQDSACPQVRIQRLAGERGRQNVGRRRKAKPPKPSIFANTTPARWRAWLGPQPTVQMPGERDEMMYIPLGVGVVIPPWNFPLAILAGMTAATLVTGNTAIIKPSSETPTIAAKFAEVLLEAGFPKQSFTLLTGSGAAVGDVLVEHPKTRFVAFTGPRDVGLRINELAAKTQPGQIWIKRVVAEMGGKDAIVVDANCDLEKAVDGVLASAFGYQGQKCSACSRAIVDAKIYDEFLDQAHRQGEEPEDRPDRRSVELHGPGDQRERAQNHSGIHRHRQE